MVRCNTLRRKRSRGARSSLPWGLGIGMASLVLGGWGCSDDAASPPAVAVDPSQVVLSMQDSSGVFEVRNAGEGQLTWELEHDAPWLDLQPVRGATEDRSEVSFQVLVDSLPRGPHMATVSVTSNGGSVELPIWMWTLMATQPDSVHLDSDQTESPIVLAPLSDKEIGWQAGASEAWISITPEAGTLRSSGDTLRLAVDRSALTPGAYAGAVWIDAGAYGLDTVRVAAQVAAEATVSGHVTYQGTMIPVPDVRVAAVGVADTTGADGTYLLRGVPLGEQEVTATREGFTPAQKTIDLSPAGLVQDFALTSDAYTYTVSGQVTNARGVGIANGWVTLLNPGDSKSTLRTRTRTGGGYELPNVPPGERRLLFEALHYQDLISPVTVEEGAVDHPVQIVAETVGPPAPLAGPHAIRIDCGRVRVSWDPGLLENLQTVAGYRVERSLSAQGPFEDVSGLIADPSAVEYDDEDLIADRLHYRLRTENIDGLVGPTGGASEVKLEPWVELHPEGPQGETPEERWGHYAVYDPNDGQPRMLIVGGTGCESGTCGIDFGDVWSLDLTQITWELLDEGTGPADRNEHTVVLDQVRRRLVVYGGKLSEGERVYGDTWAFDLTTRTWDRIHAGGAGSPGSRFGHVAVLDLDEDRMIVYGGYDNAVKNDVWAFDLAAHSWTQLRSGAIGELDPQPRGRYDHTATLDPVARRMIIQGGSEMLGTSTEECWAFRLDDDTWERLPDGPRRCRHQMDYDADNHRAVFFGGWRYATTGQSGARFHDTWVLDLASDQWLELSGAEEEGRPDKRDRHSMILEPEHGALYIFGGLLELEGLGDDAWTYCAGER